MFEIKHLHLKNNIIVNIYIKNQYRYDTYNTVLHKIIRCFRSHLQILFSISQQVFDEGYSCCANEFSISQDSFNSKFGAYHLLECHAQYSKTECKGSKKQNCFSLLALNGNAKKALEHLIILEQRISKACASVTYKILSQICQSRA